MSSDPPASDPERLRYYITDLELQPSVTDPNCKISANIFVDEELLYTFPWIDNTQPSRWSRLILCDASQSSSIVLRLSRSLRDKHRSFTFPTHQLSEVDEGTGEMTLERPELVWTATVKYLTPTMAQRLFPDELNKPSRIEGIYDSLKPDETIKYLFNTALQFSRITAEVLPEDTAKLSFLIVVKAWEILEKQTRLDDTIQAILRGLFRIQGVVEVLNQASSSMLVVALAQSKEPINNILTLLEDVSVYIYNRLVTNDPANLSRDIAHTRDAYDIEAYSAVLENLQKEFHASWLPSAAPCMDQTNVIEDEDLVPECPHDMVVDPTAKPIIDPYEILNQLRPMDPTGYDPDRACLDGTREAILNRIITWTQNRENSESFMWISGQAGMGKTSIANSLCKRLDKIRALAGSFFCQRDDPESSDPLRLINNLVHSIALRFPSYAHEVANAIRMDRTLCTSHLSLRYEGLIKRPIERLKSSSIPRTFVVVVDGLDECGDYDSRERILHKLYEMSRLAPWLKVIFTARPEGDLVEYFENHDPQKLIVRLQTYDAVDDIRAYVQYQLGSLARKEQWLDSSIKQLCAMAQGVFLWAALATKYIKESSIPALSRLRKVLENRKSPVIDHFDALYTRALQVAMKNDEDETKVAYSRCIGVILATSERGPITVSNLQHLLLAADKIEPGTLERIVVNLGPLLLVTDGQYVRFHHSSFKDYATDPARSHSSPIRLTLCESDLAYCCLQVMQKELRFNICELETSHLPNSEVPDLKLRVHSHIGWTLQYACTHWIEYFTASPNQASIEAIKTFMEGPQFMYWVEVLSLIGCLDVAVTGLSTLASLMLAHFSDWTLIVAWLMDAHRFLLAFYDAVSTSAPHLYISALAFAPIQSLTAQRMRTYFPNTISPPKGGNLTWHPLIKSTLHPHPIQSLSLSPDGLSVATGYPDGSVGIWGVRTGAPIHKPLPGHSTSVTCVAFSPTGNLLASSSYDTTIQVWDLSSLETSRVLTGHSSSIHSVAFSPSASLIASGSSDKTIRLWDTKTMQPMGQPYEGHLGRVSCLAFSPDGSRLVSGSWDKTIRVWTVGAQGLSGDPLLITGHSDSVTCVAFSPEGLRVASGSMDKTMRMWDVQTGSEVEPCNSASKHSDNITSVAFSSNGRLIASGSLDGAVQLLEAATLAALPTPFRHHHPVNGVAFFPDGAYVVSGSTDQTVRVWGMSSNATSITSFVAHSSTVYSIAVSNDGTRIISGSGDKTVKMWDAQTGTLLGDPYLGHSNHAYSVAFAPDGTKFVSGSHDKTMKLWNTTTYTAIKSYQHDSIIYCVAFSPDGALIAFGTDNHTVCLWEHAGWKMIGHALQGHTNYVYSVAFSPDGTYLASSSGDHTVTLWHIKTHSRSGALLSGHTGPVRSIAFSPCGTRLVSGSDDNKVRLWDLKTRETIMELTGHSGIVMSVAFSPDGSSIASGSFDKTVRLWNTKNGQMIGQPFSGHSNYVRSIAFSPDGNYIISSSEDTTIRAWSLDARHTPVEQVHDSPGISCSTSNLLELSPHPHHLGWVTQDQKSLVLWLPERYRQADQTSSVHTQGPQASLDYSKFVHGTDWTRVACDRIRHNSS